MLFYGIKQSLLELDASLLCAFDKSALVLASHASVCAWRDLMGTLFNRETLSFRKQNESQ
ncbi:unnamed protein product [Camellia sinensis]